ncbi:MAG: flagellar basal body P-ring formation chaperone FlgA [Rubrivivax sp.]
MNPAARQRPPLRATLLALAWIAAAAPSPAQTGAAPADAAIETAMAAPVRALVDKSLRLPPAAAGEHGQPPRVEIEIGRLDPRLRLAPCKRIEPQLPPQARLWGRTRIGLRCVEGERPWQVWLPVTVKVFAPALVAQRALPAGTELTAADLHSAEVDWAAEAQAPLTQADKLVGRTLSRALQPGQALRSGDLKLRQWFGAGDTVQILARGDGFAVSGEGQALSSGVEGQPVRVRTESGRVLTGVPVAERRVELTL